jgi:hypothetical protein
MLIAPVEIDAPFRYRCPQNQMLQFPGDYDSTPKVAVANILKSDIWIGILSMVILYCFLPALQPAVRTGPFKQQVIM